MKPESLPHIEPVQHLIERTAAQAREAGVYPTIFDEQHLPETVHGLIEYIRQSGQPLEIPAERRRAERAVCAEVGRFMQANHLL